MSTRPPSARHHRGQQADVHAEPARTTGDERSGGSMIRRRIERARRRRRERCARSARASASGARSALAQHEHARRPATIQRRRGNDSKPVAALDACRAARRGTRVSASEIEQQNGTGGAQRAPGVRLQHRVDYLLVGTASQASARRFVTALVLPAATSTVCAMPSSTPILRLPAQHPLGLLDRRPAAHDVDLEARQVLELQRVRVVARQPPAELGDLGDGQLVARRDVEVLVQRRRAARWR